MMVENAPPESAGKGSAERGATSTADRRTGRGSVTLVADEATEPLLRRKPLPPYRSGLLAGLLLSVVRPVFAGLNRRWQWYLLKPSVLGVVNAMVLRVQLRRDNVVDTNPPVPAEAPGCQPRWRTARRPDGRCNDLGHPEMGSAGQRFGRNIPLEDARPQAEADILTPSPRTISNRLLAREEFLAAPQLNLLAAAWIQFQVHDWATHEPPMPPFPAGEWRIDLEEGDSWSHGCPMRIPKTRPDPPRPEEAPGRPPVYANTSTHWWDVSEVYGSDAEKAAAVRQAGRGELRLERTGLVPERPGTDVVQTGFSNNWWVGLDLMHSLFAREHNRIVRMLRADGRTCHLSEDDLYDKARLINAAVVAKIHVLEWTPAILAMKTVRLGEDWNWWGVQGRASHRWLRHLRRNGRLFRSEELSGIPGSPVNHYGEPFAMTEEFVAVYRLHSLLPDTIRFRSLDDGRTLREMEMRDLLFDASKERGKLSSVGIRMEDAMYSFGISYPGALVLHNYPTFLRELQLPDEQGGECLDLAATDIMRDRERGVPRYNRFRRLFHLPELASFDEFDARYAEELKEMYGDIEQVDLQVGMLAERLPQGFGFSDTAFRVFLLMAERRLKSDRFFTDDFRPEVYTQPGMEWAEQRTMRDVLLDDCPVLHRPLRGIDNPFRPWRRVASVR
jgi:Animal haem peroxidase